MRFRSVHVVPVFAVLLALAPPVLAQQGETHATAKKNARAAAESWLALLDDEAFGESWEKAAPLFQKRIKREDWVRNAERLRDSVGTLSSRTLARAKYRDSLSQAPINGPFVLLKYRSTVKAGRFEELLLTVLDSSRDTTWKVTGYRVTPLRTSTP